MAEDRGPVKRSEGKKMEASRKQGNNNTIIKRKRLDANIFKKGHIDQAKKYKGIFMATFLFPCIFALNVVNFLHLSLENGVNFC